MDCTPLSTLHWAKKTLCTSCTQPDQSGDHCSISKYGLQFSIDCTALTCHQLDYESFFMAQLVAISPSFGLSLSLKITVGSHYQTLITMWVTCASCFGSRCCRKQVICDVSPLATQLQHLQCIVICGIFCAQTMLHRKSLSFATTWQMRPATANSWIHQRFPVVYNLSAILMSWHLHHSIRCRLFACMAM